MARSPSAKFTGNLRRLQFQRIKFNLFGFDVQLPRDLEQAIRDLESLIRFIFVDLIQSRIELLVLEANRLGVPVTNEGVEKPITDPRLQTIQDGVDDLIKLIIEILRQVISHILGKVVFNSTLLPTDVIADPPFEVESFEDVIISRVNGIVELMFRKAMFFAVGDPTGEGEGFELNIGGNMTDLFAEAFVRFFGTD